MRPDLLRSPAIARDLPAWLKSRPGTAAAIEGRKVAKPDFGSRCQGGGGGAPGARLAPLHFAPAIPRSTSERRGLSVPESCIPAFLSLLFGDVLCLGGSHAFC